MELRKVLRATGKQWIAVALCTLVGLGIALAYNATATKIYASTARSFVAMTAESASDGSALQSAQFAAQRVKSYSQIASSPDVLQPVIEELGLKSSPEAVARQITVANPPNTVLLDLTASDTNPDRAARIANATSLQLARVINKIEAPAGSKSAPVKVSLISPATASATPASPRSLMNLLLGLLFGLGLGIAYALLRDAMDRSVKSSNELESSTGLPVLGEVIFDGQAGERIAALDTASVQSEGYRTVRTNMQFLNIDNPPKVVTVTSAAPGDGKSTTACNLAVAFALGGAKTLLVEGDLRRPRVTQYLGLDGSVGLTDVLASRVSLDEAIQPWMRGTIDVLPSGAIPPNPSELLGSAHMGSLLDKLRDRYDIVVVDASPLLAVSDSAILAAQTDGTLLVVRHGKSTFEQVRDSLAALDHVKAELLGTIINAVPVRRSKKGRYGYGYGYGYGYSDKPQEQPQAEVADVSDAEVTKTAESISVDSREGQVAH